MPSLFERLNKGRLQQINEAIEQRRKSTNPISQWAQECIINDKIELDRGPYGVAMKLELGTRIATKLLYKSCVSYCRREDARPPNKVAFGRACTRMFGPRQHVEDGGKRPLGYDVPEREKWQEVLDKRLGIPKQWTARGAAIPPLGPGIY